MQKPKIFGQNKLLSHPEKIVAQKNGRPSLITAEIDLTNVCNSKCPGCIGWFGDEKDKSRLSPDEALRYIQQLQEQGARGLIFTGGGEPLVNWDAFKVAVPYASMVGLDVGVITNGIAMRDEARQIISDYATWCRVSLDAGEPEMYEKTHGQGRKVFEEVVINTASLARLVKQEGSKCTVGVGYLTGEDTISGMVDFAKLAAKLGVDYAQFRPFHGDHTPIDKEFAKAKSLERNGFKVTCSAQKYSRFGDTSKRPYDTCYGGYFASVIGADAKVYWCCHTRGMPQYAVGDLRKDSLEEILSPDNLRRFEKQISDAVCPAFCRADEMNRTMNEIVRPKQHINFL